MAFQTEFESSDRLTFTATDNYELLVRPFTPPGSGFSIPAGGYSFADAQVSYSIGRQRRINGHVAVKRGAYFDGDLTTVELTQGYISVLPQLSVEPTVSFNWIDTPYGGFQTNLAVARVNYAFNPRTFFSGLPQYNSAGNSFSSNLRLRWEYSPGSELFVVYTDERDVSAGLRPDRGWALRNRGFVVKLNRLFRSDLHRAAGLFAPTWAGGETFYAHGKRTGRDGPLATPASSLPASDTVLGGLQNISAGRPRYPAPSRPAIGVSRMWRWKLQVPRRLPEPQGDLGRREPRPEVDLARSPRHAERRHQPHEVHLPRDRVSGSGATEWRLSCARSPRPCPERSGLRPATPPPESRPASGPGPRPPGPDRLEVGVPARLSAAARRRTGLRSPVARPSPA